MMTKSKARAPGGLLRHLVRTDTNEHMALGDTRDVTADPGGAMMELAIRGATARGRKNLFHVIGNPEPGTVMSELHWTDYWTTFEDEFDLAAQPFVEVRHTKKGRDHRHRVYSLVRDDGRLIPTGHNFRRNELVSRLTEITAGHPVRPGRFHGWVVREIESRGISVSQPLAGATRPEHHARLRQHEQQQGERKLVASDPRHFKTAVYELWAGVDGDWRRFASALDAARITVARGDAALLVIDEISQFQLPLARLLREEAKRANRPLKIKSADLETVFARAKPLSEETGAVRERSQAHSTQAAIQKAEKPRAAEQRSPVVEELARSMAIHMAVHLAAERRRRARLEENRRRKLARERPTFEARLLAVADAACLSVAAHLVRCLRDERLALRTTVQMLGAVALVNGLAPLLLGAAAIAMARRIQVTAEHDAFRADIDQAKAARSGFSFADVPSAGRAGYAALLRSSLFEAEGSDAGPLITGLGPDKAAAFVAWWAHASDRQRAVVQGWSLQGSVDLKSKLRARVTVPDQKGRTQGNVGQQTSRRPQAGTVRAPLRKSPKRSTFRER